MNIEEEVFRKTKIDESKLVEYGFKKIDNKYKYSKNILDNSFKIDIVVDENYRVEGKILDNAFNEEYTNFRVSNMQGEFVGIIKNEFVNLLNDIKEKCTVFCPFIFEQSNRIAELIKTKYNSNPIFKWDKFPGYAIFKNSATDKWYGIIMNLDKGKLDSKSSGEVEIIDIKLDPAKIQTLLKSDGFYPAYHMNKSNWITIILDDTISDKELMTLIEESYSYSTIDK